MDPQVIEIGTREVNSQRKWRIVSAVLQASVWSSGMVLWQYFAHRSRPSRETIIELAFIWIPVGLCYALLLLFLPLPNLGGVKKSPLARARLIIELDQVAWSVQNSDDSTWSQRSVVTKGKIRSIFRVPGGIGVSERGQLGARMLGFLMIPNTLPMFNEVKAMLERWREGATNDTP